MNQRIELVLTAHPTQVMRRTLLSKNNKVANCLDKYAFSVPPIFALILIVIKNKQIRYSEHYSI